MSRPGEPIQLAVDAATTILRALTSAGIEAPPDLSCDDASDAPATDGRPIMWF